MASQPKTRQIECWDDDDDFQDGDSLNMRHVSTTTVNSTSIPRRDSVSSRLSTRSDRDSSNGVGGDEEWQVTIPAEQQESFDFDAINSAQNAGIPIPRNVPTSALLGGTIKRLGGRRLKKVLGDDWGDDLELPNAKDGSIMLKQTQQITEFPASIRTASNELASPKNASRLEANADFLDRLASATTQSASETSEIERFKDLDLGDDDFAEGFPTIKMARDRLPQKALPFGPCDIDNAKAPTDAEDFENDLVLPGLDQPLNLSLRAPKTPAMTMHDDSDLEWAEGSLGTRVGGTRRDRRSNPASSITFSPSASSCLTAESDEDRGLDGLVLPESNFKFGEALKRRMENARRDIVATVDESPRARTTERQHDEKDDFFSGIDVRDGEVFDSGKLTLNRNIKLKAPAARSPTRRPATTLTFTNRVDAGQSRIPRPQTLETRTWSTLESVAESGPASNYRRPGSRLGLYSSPHASNSSAIPAPSTPSGRSALPSTPNRRVLNRQTSREIIRSDQTTNVAPYLKNKRSMPLMGRTQPSPARSNLGPRPSSRAGERCETSLSNVRKTVLPLHPSAGATSSQSHTAASKATRNFLRPSSSDSNETGIYNRPLSRLSHPQRPGTPSRRHDHAPESLLREAALKRTLTKPMCRRIFGDGNELEVFDDLPTSAVAESRFTKQPVARGAPKSLQMRNRLGLHQNLSSTSVPDLSAGNFYGGGSQPPSPNRQDRVDHVPSFARDTNASRLAREQRLGSVNAALHGPEVLNYSEMGPIANGYNNHQNWRSGTGQANNLSVPSSMRKRGRGPPQKPRLIKPIGNFHNQPKTEKGMHWNPQLYRWEGNENVLVPFDIPAPSSAPHRLSSPHSPKQSVAKAAPALIANMGAPKGVQMSGGMIFDPQRMCWLKAGPGLSSVRHGSNPVSQGSTDDDEDPFAGFEDLEDKPRSGSLFSPISSIRTESRMKNITAEQDLNLTSTTTSATTTDHNLDVSHDSNSDDLEPLVISEEFDVGPEFIRRLQTEEERWRVKVNGWVGSRERHEIDASNDWRWTIRRKAMGY